MFTVVVQLNCTRPVTPLLLILTPPVVRIVEVEFPLRAPPGVENDSSMLESRYGSPLMMTDWFLQSRNSMREDERKPSVGPCGSGLSVMTIDPPPLHGMVIVFVSTVVRPARAAWLIACDTADITADSVERLDDDDGEEGDWPPHPAAKATQATTAMRWRQPMNYSSCLKIIRLRYFGVSRVRTFSIQLRITRYSSEPVTAMAGRATRNDPVDGSTV